MPALAPPPSTISSSSARAVLSSLRARRSGTRNSITPKLVSSVKPSRSMTMSIRRLVFGSLTEKPNDSMMVMTSRASAGVAAGPSAQPKSSMYTIKANVRPLARSTLATTAVKRQKGPAEALRPKGRTQYTYCTPSNSNPRYFQWAG